MNHRSACFTRNDATRRFGNCVDKVQIVEDVINLTKLHIATHSCKPTTVAQLDVAKQPLNYVKPMSTAITCKTTSRLHCENVCTKFISL